MNDNTLTLAKLLLKIPTGAVGTDEILDGVNVLWNLVQEANDSFAELASKIDNLDGKIDQIFRELKETQIRSKLNSFRAEVISPLETLNANCRRYSTNPGELLKKFQSKDPFDVLVAMQSFLISTPLNPSLLNDVINLDYSTADLTSYCEIMGQYMDNALELTARYTSLQGGNDGIATKKAATAEVEKIFGLVKNAYDRLEKCQRDDEWWPNRVIGMKAKFFAQGRSKENMQKMLERLQASYPKLHFAIVVSWAEPLCNETNTIYEKVKSEKYNDDQWLSIVRSDYVDRSIYEDFVSKNRDIWTSEHDDFPDIRRNARSLPGNQCQFCATIVEKYVAENSFLNFKATVTVYYPDRVVNVAPNEHLIKKEHDVIVGFGGVHGKRMECDIFSSSSSSCIIL